MESDDQTKQWLLPLMAVVQKQKNKVRPVLDFRELNPYISSHTMDLDSCDTKLREWRQKSENIQALDLRNAYLQLHVKENLRNY